MEQSKNVCFMNYIWSLVPVLSLIRLCQPMMDICVDNGPYSTVCFSMPVKTYNGLQLLFHSKLVNGYNAVVADMSNPGLVLLKMMIALQLVLDLILIVFCLREWKRKQISKHFLWQRGMLSMGYLVTGVAICYLIPLCCSYLGKSYELTFTYTRYHQYNPERNAFLSLGVVLLFVMTWLLWKTGTIYQMIYYIWFLVPVLSIVIFLQPVLEIGVDTEYRTIEEEMRAEEEEESLQEMIYNGFQLLFLGSLENQYQKTIIDGKNVGFIAIKVMTVLQLVYDVILAFLVFWEWRWRLHPKKFLWLRGILSAGYVLTAFTIYYFVLEWGDYEIEQHSSRSYFRRTSFVYLDYLGVDYNVALSIAVVVLFVITVVLSKYKRKEIYSLLS